VSNSYAFLREHDRQQWRTMTDKCAARLVVPVRLFDLLLPDAENAGVIRTLSTAQSAIPCQQSPQRVRRSEKHSSVLFQNDK
jgi:hypothetical protein